MPKICVSVFCASWYRSYLPLFLFCLFEAYPDYEAVVFLRKPLGHIEKPGMEIVKDMGNVEFVYINGFPKLENRAEQVRLFQCGRFLVLTPVVVEFLSKYEYVYLTDVDILIMPERIPLHKQHIQHMEVLQLPYSNFVRNTDVPRLTGLHFANLDFYRRVAPVVELYADMIKVIGIPDGYGRCADEELWYRIVRESGLGLPPKCNLSEQKTWGTVFDPDGYENIWFGPHHGVHVGFGRSMKRFRSIFGLPFYKQYMRQLEEMMLSDGRFGVLYDGLHPRAKAAFTAVVKAGR